MSPRQPVAAEVFTVREIARAAAVAPADVRLLIERDGVELLRTRFLSLEDARRLVACLVAPDAARLHPRALFAPPRRLARRTGMPAAVSGAVHAGVLAVMLLAAGLGVRSETPADGAAEPMRLVFLATAGPGGGGGGGGLRNPLPPRRAELEGTKKQRSPVTLTRPVERREPPRRQTPRPAPPLPAPAPRQVPPLEETRLPITAPVVSVPADAADTSGVATEAASAAPSGGPGAGGGTGTGVGTGMGEGQGAGLGDGTGGGTGGGPYRPGSGVTPPSLVREVKPIYTEEGRVRGVEGDVLMEVVIRADGAVGSVRVLQGLGSGLDQRAVEAVRQWRFSPARRFGTPVDVLVEIAVEFRLR